MIINWLKYIPGWPLVKLCRQLEFVFNVLNGLEGVNCRVLKPTEFKGYGWKIVVDGGSDTDNAGGEMPTGWPNPPFSGGLPTGTNRYEVPSWKADGTTDSWQADWVRAHG